MDLSAYDPNTVAVVSGLVGVVIGAVFGSTLTEVFARRRERRADERDDAAHRRDVQLTAIEQTQRQLAALLADLGATVAGPGAAAPGRYGADAYPKADVTLVGDATALRQLLGVAADLGGRPPASGLRRSDAERMAAAELAVRNALEDQASRVRAGQPARKFSPQDLSDLIGAFASVLRGMEGRSGGTHGVPPNR